MISVETYLSFMSYDGIGARGVPLTSVKPVQEVTVKPIAQDVGC